MKHYRFAVLQIILSFSFFPLFTSRVMAAGSDFISSSTQEVLTTYNTQGRALSVTVPRRGLSPENVAVVVNSQDPKSVETANYFMQVHKIPAGNLIPLSFVPNRSYIRLAEFNTIKNQVDTALKSRADVQAIAIAWTEPWVVYQDQENSGMSLTSAITLGFNKKYFNWNNRDFITAQSLLFNNQGSRPFTDFGMRPAMMIAGADIQQVKGLINRAQSAEGTFPLQRGYLLTTSDAARSLRTPRFLDSINFWNFPGGLILTHIDNSKGKASNFIENKNDVLFYFTGLSTVPSLTTNQFIPGSVGDHLTSFGGKLTGPQSQMSILRWLEAGAAASYGTVQEPYAIADKFPRPNVLMRHYFSGATLLEAYWKSVAKPGEGVFVGDPLTRPYATRISVDVQNILKIKTTLLDPNKVYSLYAAETKESPLKLLKSGIRLEQGQPQVKWIETQAVYPFYVLKEEADPTLPKNLTNDGQGQRSVKASGQWITWLDTRDSYSPDFADANQSMYVFDSLTQQRRKLLSLTSYSTNQIQVEGDYAVVFNRLIQGIYCRLMRVNLRTGSYEVLLPTSDQYIVTDPWLRQNRVFWFDRMNGIMQFNIANRQLTAVVPISKNPTNHFDVQQDLLVWKDQQKNLKVLQISTKAEKVIVDFALAKKNDSTLIDMYQPKLSGNNVYVVQENQRTPPFTLVRYDSKSLVKVELLRGNFIQKYPQLFYEMSDQWLAFLEQRNGESQPSLYAYHLSTGVDQRIKLGPYDTFKDISDRQPYRQWLSLTANRLAWNMFSRWDQRTDVFVKDLSVNRRPAMVNIPSQVNLRTTDTLSLYVLAVDSEKDPVQFSALTDGQPVSKIGARFSVVTLQDINADGQVNSADYQLLNQNLGRDRKHPLFNPRADLNNDGKVDQSDVSISTFNAQGQVTHEIKAGWLQWPVSARPARTVPCSAQGCRDVFQLSVNDDYHFPAATLSVQAIINP